MAARALGQDQATVCESQQCAQGGLNLPGICLWSPHLEQLRIKEVLSQRRSEKSSRAHPKDSDCELQEVPLLAPLASAPRATDHQNLRERVRVGRLQNIESQAPP